MKVFQGEQDTCEANDSLGKELEEKTAFRTLADDSLQDQVSCTEDSDVTTDEQIHPDQQVSPEEVASGPNSPSSKREILDGHLTTLSNTDSKVLFSLSKEDAVGGILKELLTDVSDEIRSPETWSVETVEDEQDDKIQTLLQQELDRLTTDNVEGASDPFIYPSGPVMVPVKGYKVMLQYVDPRKGDVSPEQRWLEVKPEVSSQKLSEENPSDESLPPVLLRPRGSADLRRCFEGVLAYIEKCHPVLHSFIKHGNKRQVADFKKDITETVTDILHENPFKYSSSRRREEKQLVYVLAHLTDSLQWIEANLRRDPRNFFKTNIPRC